MVRALLPLQGAWFNSPGLGTKILPCHAVQPKGKKNLIMVIWKKSPWFDYTAENIEELVLKMATKNQLVPNMIACSLVFDGLMVNSKSHKLPCQVTGWHLLVNDSRIFGVREQAFGEQH